MDSIVARACSKPVPISSRSHVWPAGTLTAGAKAVVAAHPARIIWLGAIGAGPSNQATGPVSVHLLKTFMRAEYGDKSAADATVVAAGGTVFHAAPLSDKPLSATRRTVTLDDVPKRFFPAGVSRATVAAAMLDEAETPRFPHATVVPLASR